MNALIIEDERMAQARLAKILNINFPDISVVGTADSVASAVAWLSSNPAPDIIFMDVELLDGDCFEIFRQVEIRSNVIMTTAYDSYAIKAFEAGSVDYLLKPITLEDLKRAVGRCRERIAAPDIDALLKALGKAPGKKYKERSVVRSGDKIIPVGVEDIAYFFSEDKANYLMTHGGTRYIIESTMDTLEAELDPAMFFRISRGCIISLTAIVNVTRLISGKLLVKATPAAPMELSVARPRVDDFLSWLEA